MPPSMPPFETDATLLQRKFLRRRLYSWNDILQELLEYLRLLPLAGLPDIPIHFIFVFDFIDERDRFKGGESGKDGPALVKGRRLVRCKTTKFNPANARHLYMPLRYITTAVFEHLHPDNAIVHFCRDLSSQDGGGGFFRHHGRARAHDR